MLPVVHARLLRKEEQVGGYTVLVFEDVERPCAPDRYIMCTMLPNWDEIVCIKEGDVGYLSYREVIAGQDTWWEGDSKEYNFYNYDAAYFDKFVLDKPEQEKIKLD